MASTKKQDLADSLKNLKIDPHAPPKSIAKSSLSKKSKAPVADSWEDEALSDESEDENSGAGDSLSTPTAPSQTPSAPPPTPISPSSPDISRSQVQAEHRLVSTIWESSSTLNNDITPPRENKSRVDRDRDVEKRPEKTDAVAKRMIAGALGIRAPKKTEEQKRYEQAIKESEKGRREREREEVRRREEAAERAKREIWEG